MGYRLLLLAVLLALPRVGHAFPCEAFFRAVGKGVRDYGKEVRDSYGLRVIARSVDPADLEEERRLLLFWRQRQADDPPISVRALNRLRKSLGKPMLTPKQRIEFDLLGGIDHIIQTPLRLGTGALVRRGVMNHELRFTIPALIALSYPAIDMPLNALRESNERREEKRRENLVRFDYRFRQLERTLGDAEAEWAKMAQTGVPKELLDNTKEAFRKVLLEDVGRLEAMHSQYRATAESFRDKYRQAVSPEEINEIDKLRVVTLVSTPLFADIARLLRVETTDQLFNPEIFPVVEALVTQRERLFFRYSLVPVLMGGGAALVAQEKNAEARAEIESMRASPVYQNLAAEFRAGKVTKEKWQRALMEDSFWQLEKFERWEMLGQEPPPEIGADGLATGEALNIATIRNEILSSVK